MSSSGSNDGGLMSNAGLVQYYDSDSNAIRINPKTILAFSIFLAVFLMGVHAVL